MVSVAGPAPGDRRAEALPPPWNAAAVGGCDPSDTGKVQTTGSRPLRLIHEIERLELARVSRVDPTYGRPEAGDNPGRRPRPEPTRGMRLSDQLNGVYTGTGDGPYRIAWLVKTFTSRAGVADPGWTARLSWRSGPHGLAPSRRLP